MNKLNKKINYGAALSKMTTPKKTSPVQDYVAAKAFRHDRLWSIRNGTSYTKVDGENLSQADFDKRFPVISPLNALRSNENPDKTREFLKD